MDSVCSRTRAQLSSLPVPAPALLAPPARLARDGSSLLPPSQRHEPTLRRWILGFRHVLVSSPKPAKPRAPPGRSAALTIAIRRVGEGLGPGPSPVSLWAGQRRWQFPLSMELSRDQRWWCPVFTPRLGQSRVPKGTMGMHGGGAPLPHTSSSLALLSLPRALLVLGSPLENLLRTTRPGNGVREPGSE